LALFSGREKRGSSCKDPSFSHIRGAQERGSCKNPSYVPARDS
jgi:hypothetical protein